MPRRGEVVVHGVDGERRDARSSVRRVPPWRGNRDTGNAPPGQVGGGAEPRGRAWCGRSQTERRIGASPRGDSLEVPA